MEERAIGSKIYPFENVGCRWLGTLCFSNVVGADKSAAAGFR